MKFVAVRHSLFNGIGNVRVVSARAFCRRGACTVVNVIATGHVADASKAMDDFDAFVGCSQAAGTTAAREATGSTATILVANSIGSGDLSGGFMTSGGITTTQSNGAVISGTYAMDGSGRKSV